MGSTIRGRVVERVEGFGDQLALVTVAGVPRRMSGGSLDDGAFDVGSWVVIHMGFAREVVDETADSECQDGLDLLGRADPEPSDPDSPDRPDRDRH